MGALSQTRRPALGALSALILSYCSQLRESD
jgi:hypothetical protein